jgi:hypothetical protein
MAVGKPSAPAAPMMKNASAAPVIFFDNAPVMGAFSGNIEVELTTRVLMPKPDGKVVAELNCVGHLRCSPQAAVALIEALEKGLAIHSSQGKQPGAVGDDGEAPPLNS